MWRHVFKIQGGSVSLSATTGTQVALRCVLETPLLPDGVLAVVSRIHVILLAAKSSLRSCLGIGSTAGVAAATG